MFKLFCHSKSAALICLALFALSLFSGCTNQASGGFSGAYVIMPKESYSEADKKWAKYLSDHLQRRGGDGARVYYEKSMYKGSEIKVHIDENLKGDFEIENDDKGLTLTAKDDRTILWLIYQFMRKVGDTDPAYEISDLPMSIVSFNDTLGTFPFAYRDIFLPTNLDPDMSGILCTHNLDHDWGLWGHNLHKIIPEDATDDIYAKVNGKVDKRQYCFSSDELYSHIVNHIIDNHGIEHCHHNFAILPNDNDIVCQCSECVALGNEKNNATPAASHMLHRLAGKFPNHSFFTIAYRTTRIAPKEPLPLNAGVLISAIDWPLGLGVHDKGAKKFRDKFADWNEKTGNIYIWDYINNFDDYLTPFPILRTMKYRLQTYCDMGVKGLFLNGSGYDYSTFEYFHTCILSALMLNPHMSLKTLVDDHFRRRFPVSGTILREYYSELMNAFEESGRIMTWYSGIEDTEAEFLNRERFIKYYKRISEIIKDTHDEEEFRLRRLLTALTFTRLEIARHAGFIDSIGYATLDGHTIKPENKIINYLHRLADNHKLLGFDKYSETGDKIEDYIRDWKKLVLVPEHYSSLLFGEKLKIRNGSNVIKTDKLTDGQPGLPDSYHSGWLLLEPDESQIVIPNKFTSKGRALRFNFLQMGRHRISVPAKVEVWQGNKLVRTVHPKPNSTRNKTGIAFCDVPIGSNVGSDVVLKIYPSTPGHNIAIDEIYLTPKEK